MKKTYVGITVVGKDREGAVAAFTNMVFDEGGNVEKISQNVVKLWCDVDLFRNYFNLHKKCVCPINNCKHYKKALTKVLGNRIHDLCLRNIDIGIRIHYDVYGK